MSFWMEKLVKVIKDPLLVKKYLTAKYFSYLEGKRKKENELFFKQGFTTIKCGNFEIKAPKSHLLIKLLKFQPYWDLCVGIAARYISKKYPEGTFVDVGANIGDTAAMMASYAPNNKLILIEGSDFFYNILSRNSAKLPNKIVLSKLMIFDGSDIDGCLQHWGGTAYFKWTSSSEDRVQTERLCDAVDSKTCFVKIDTDGFDCQILLDSLDWLKLIHPAILFENQIRTQQDLDLANSLFDRLALIGYSYFMVWDDSGFHLLSTTSVDNLKDLNRYMLKTHQVKALLMGINNCINLINNYDILCLHENDKDIFESLKEWWQTY